MSGSYTTSSIEKNTKIQTNVNKIYWRLARSGAMKLLMLVCIYVCLCMYLFIQASNTALHIVTKQYFTAGHLDVIFIQNILFKLYVDVNADFFRISL
jgi:hypothetical protein